MIFKNLIGGANANPDPEHEVLPSREASKGEFTTLGTKWANKSFRSKKGDKKLGPADIYHFNFNLKGHYFPKILWKHYLGTEAPHYWPKGHGRKKGIYDEDLREFSVALLSSSHPNKIKILNSIISKIRNLRNKSSSKRNNSHRTYINKLDRWLKALEPSANPKSVDQIISMFSDSTPEPVLAEINNLSNALGSLSLGTDNHESLAEELLSGSGRSRSKSKSKKPNKKSSVKSSTKPRAKSRKTQGKTRGKIPGKGKRRKSKKRESGGNLLSFITMDTIEELNKKIQNGTINLEELELKQKEFQKIKKTLEDNELDIPEELEEILKNIEKEIEDIKENDGWLALEYN